MPTVTISRQYGSGGSDIGKLVAEELGWTLVDNEFVDLVAQKAGMSPEQVREREERGSSLIERLARALALATPDVYVGAPEASPPAVSPERNLAEMTNRVIEEVVKSGDHVMVGRGSQAFLAESKDTLHVFIVAPLEERARRVEARLGLSPQEALRTVEDTDSGRRAYVKSNYDRTWEDPANYHLVINTGEIPYSEAAEIISNTVRRRGWQ